MPRMQVPPSFHSLTVDGISYVAEGGIITVPPEHEEAARAFGCTRAPVQVALPAPTPEPKAKPEPKPKGRK